MVNLTERNGIILSCEPSLNAHIFIFFLFLNFEFVSLCFCFVLSFFFLLIFQAATSLFLFHLIVENLNLLENTEK